ncbi:hypothetical protein [Ornithinimicrobium panacihumi]|uniref:hypothetical protein n=1 Tax=Ornithinimicrobium panacihumi TaxID=2008449 RepID=UPI003F8A8A71
MWSSIIASLATLAGAGLAFFFQRANDKRREEVESRQRMWDQRRDALLQLIAGLVAFRKENYQKEKAALSTSPTPAHAESVRLARAAGRVNYYRAALLFPAGSAIPALSNTAYEKIREFYTASSLDELERLSEEAKLLVDELVTRGRDELGTAAAD